MKLFRFAGLLLIALALVGGATESARATAPVTCYYDCSTGPYYMECWASLTQCCNLMRRSCPDPGVFISGDCTDGMNYCP